MQDMTDWPHGVISVASPRKLLAKPSAPSSQLLSSYRDQRSERLPVTSLFGPHAFTAISMAWRLLDMSIGLQSCIVRSDVCIDQDMGADHVVLRLMHLVHVR
jgi:hypothetical protein